MADKYKTTISPAAAAVLTKALCFPGSVSDDPPRVVLASGALDRPVYDEVNEVLVRLGGKWHGGHTQAHVFDSDPTADVSSVISSGMMPPKNPLAFFPTPADLAKQLLDEDRLGLVAAFKAAISENRTVTILEPSAGRGALIDAAYSRIQYLLMNASANLQFVAIELDPRHAAYLNVKYADRRVDIYSGDFLTWSPTADTAIDVVIMNPPFAADKDTLAFIAHVRRAYDLLRPSGKLLAITPTSWPDRQDRRCRDFTAFVEEHGYHFENDRDAFFSSGTSAGTRTIVLAK